MLPTIKIKKNRLEPIINNITPQYVENIFNSNKNIPIQALIDKIISDDADLIGMIQKRLALPYYLIPSIAPASNNKKDKDIAVFVYNIITNIFSTNILTEILKANFYRFTVLQINWKISSGKYIISSLNPLPRTSFDFHPDNFSLMIYDQDNDSFSNIPPFSTLIALSSLSKDNSPISLIRTIRKYTIIKLFSLLDWSAFNEVFGLPLRLGKYSDNSSQDDIQNLYDAVANLGSDAAAVISQKDSIEFISPKNDNPQTFEKLYNTCKNAQATAILGNSSVTGINKNGSYAALKILSQISEDIILSDINIIQNAIKNYIIKPLVSFNFSNADIPDFEYKIPKSYKDLIEIDEKLSKLGIKFNKNYFIKKYALNPDDFDIKPQNQPFTPNSKKKTPSSSIENPYI